MISIGAEGSKLAKSQGDPWGGKAMDNPCLTSKGRLLGGKTEGSLEKLNIRPPEAGKDNCRLKDRPDGSEEEKRAVASRREIER